MNLFILHLKWQAAELGRWKFDAYALERQHGNALLHAGFMIGSELLEEAPLNA